MIGDIYDTDSQMEWLRTLQAFASIFLWFKFLYFLRIFKQTGYLIRMILDVVFSMRIFLLVLFIVILGLADAFISLSVEENTHVAFAGTNFVQALLFTYRMSLGDF